MATTTTDKNEGSKDIYLRMPEGLKARLKALTGRSHRSLNMEAVVAIEAWVNEQENATSTKDKDKENKR